MTERLIRPAKPEDSLSLAELGTRGFPGYPFAEIYDAQQLRTMIEAGKDIRQNLYSSDGSLIATGVLGTEGGPMAEIKRIVVDPYQRRNGHASAITQNLALEAQKQGYIPWSDVRADQPGMQKAALSAGLTAVSLESGKHVVYIHNGFGPARETMIHMTTLYLPEEQLWHNLKPWPEAVKNALVKNLINSFSPSEKDVQKSRLLLPDAAEVSKRVATAVSDQDLRNVNIIDANHDLLVINYSGAQMIIIKPDASGFITRYQSHEIAALVGLARKAGLQVVTCYEDIFAADKSRMLYQAGLTPSMVRPWQKKGGQLKWQIGWRQTMNGFDQCLHNLNLDDQVNRQLLGFTDQLKNNLF